MKSTKKTAAKATKKPAKKGPPLKEGKYSHKFLTRLEPETGAEFEAIKKQINATTFNGTIKVIIHDWKNATEVAKLRYERIRDLESYVQHLEGHLSRIQSTFKLISSLKI